MPLTGKREARPLNVLYVYQGDWPRNATRPAKQTRSLLEAGHTVVLLSGNPKGEPRRENVHPLLVERVPSFGSPRLYRVLGFPVFVNPVWLWAIMGAARRSRADCIIVRDLPLAAAALAIGAALRMPVHYDMADVYPVAMRANRADHPGLVSRFTRNPAVAELIERFVVRRVATVFVVSEESRNRCIGLGVAPGRVIVVGNTPENLADLQREYPIPRDIADWAGRPIVLFVGNLLADRGLAEAIDAMALVATDVPEAALAVIGDGREEANLRARVAERGLEGRVRLLGWKPHSQHAPYYAHAAVGVLPFHATEHICITLANKLFDYMGAGLPVLASDVPPMRRVLSETGAGVLVPPANVRALAHGLITLLRDPGLRKRLGEAGRHSVATRYSWTEDRRRFLDAIEGARGSH